MKKYLWIFIFFIILIIIMIYIIIPNFNNSKKQTDKYTAEKTGTQINKEQYQNNNLDEYINNQNQQEKISEFTTKLPNDTKERYSNIALACETLNESIIRSGETFSLWEILGCPTQEKGYKKAKAFTSTGKIRQSYGGGICQVSTTIYNAVLEVEGLEIIERHKHSRDVVYIKNGKDAAVSYNTADLKFKNSLDYDVKIQAKIENNKVKIELIRI